MLKIGLLGFGGGYMMLPIFFTEITVRHSWLTHREMFDIIAVSQTVPGTLATNTAALIGLHMGSMLIALVAVLGIITPSVLFAYIADKYVVPYLDYPWVQGALKGLAAVVVGIILGAGFNLMRAAVIDGPTVAIAVISFLMFFWRRINAGATMITASLIGIALINIF